ncbi:MAG TPA: hypothetical protein VGC78_10950 [Gaiellaceae bacterium]
MWPYRRAGSGRREFGRLVLTSLVKTARAELDARRDRGQRLRARRALRRLEELERALAELEELGSPLPRPWYDSAGVEAAAGAVSLGALALVAAVVAAHGPKGIVVGVLDLVMLAATVAWFAVAVARRGDRPTARHSNEGSSEAAARR